MGFVNTGNTNTLELNFTDYGKSLVGGNAGTSLLTVLASSKFALRDDGIDYRRFSAAPVPGAATTTTDGPCFDQQFTTSPVNERLSGDCFFNFADVRGRAANDPCIKTVSQTSNVGGGGPSPFPLNINLLYVYEEGIASIPPPDTGGQTPPPPPAPACFDSGYDSTQFGMNENGCACTTYTNAWEALLGASTNIGALTGSDAQLLPPMQLNDYGNYAYYYPSFESVNNFLVNSILQNVSQNANAGGQFGYWGPIQGIGNYVEATQITLTDTGGVVGDVNGDGIVGCDDLSWIVNCYCQGIMEGDNIAGTAMGAIYQSNLFNLMDSYISLAGCEGQVPSFQCNGTMAQCVIPSICGS